MDLPPVPAEATLRPGEQLAGQWDFRLRLHQAPVSEIFARFILTNERLVVLNLPTPRARYRLAGPLLGGNAARFTAEMGRWHLMLDAQLKDLPEPKLGRVEFGHPTALPTNLALILGAKNFAVGEGPAAEAMASTVRQRWVAARGAEGTPLA